MRIEDNRDQKSIETFNDIQAGECFEFHDEIFIKACSSCNSYFNALSLEDNALNMFGGGEIVKPLKAKVVIEDEQNKADD